MELSLDKVIRIITTSPKEDFIANLKEHLDDRLCDKISNAYILSLNEFFSQKLEKENEITSLPIEESKEKQVNDLLSNLKESFFDDKTIIHRFRDGNTVAITSEDSSALIKMHDNLNIINQEKMRKLMSESFVEYNKILKFSKKNIERINK